MFPSLCKVFPYIYIYVCIYMCLKGGNSTAITYNVNFFVDILTL